MHGRIIEVFGLRDARDGMLASEHVTVRSTIDAGIFRILCGRPNPGGVDISGASASTSAAIPASAKSQTFRARSRYEGFP